MRLLATGLLILSNQSLAGCFIADSFEGVISPQGADHVLSDDSLGDSSFVINIGEESAVISPSDIQCTAMNEYTALCAGSAGDGSTIEIWSVNPASNKVIYTQVRSGYTGGLSFLNGGKLLIGNLLRTCD